MKTDQTKRDQKSEKVIELDRFRPKQELTDAQKLLRLRVDLERTKLTMSVSLASLVLLVTVANQSLLKEATDATVTKVTLKDRTIASVNQVSEAAFTNQIQDSGLQPKQLNHQSLSSGASVGRRPSSLDQLTFVELDGKYAIRMQAGRVKEIEYAKVANEKPKFIVDRVAFLNSNLSLLPANASQFELESVQTLDPNSDTQKTVESYAMLSADNKKIGTVLFQLDRAGRFLGLKLETSQLALQM